nr:MAG TPA: hypothetical protein [Caudoviricetes sp.]
MIQSNPGDTRPPHGGRPHTHVPAAARRWANRTGRMAPQERKPHGRREQGNRRAGRDRARSRGARG